MAASGSPGRSIAICTIGGRNSLRYRLAARRAGRIGWSSCWKRATRRRRECRWTSTTRRRKPRSAPTPGVSLRPTPNARAPRSRAPRPLHSRRQLAVSRACKAWQAKKADAGFAAITWPKQFGGREASPILQVIYKQEEDELRGAARPVRDRSRHVHPDHDGLREAGTTRTLCASGAARRGSLVPVVLRTRGRFGPRRRCARARNATATTGSSTGRRSGPQVRICRISASSSCAPIQTCRSMRA